jgi:hypothetical protein
MKGCCSHSDFRQFKAARHDPVRRLNIPGLLLHWVDVVLVLGLDGEALRLLAQRRQEEQQGIREKGADTKELNSKDDVTVAADGRGVSGWRWLRSAIRQRLTWRKRRLEASW